VAETGCGAALHVSRGGRSGYPIGGRLGQVRSTVQRRYGAGEGTWGSESLGQGSKELVTSWAMTMVRGR
jgi:hypothetical protein